MTAIERVPVLVTGGAGYIGSHAVLALRDAGSPWASVLEAAFLRQPSGPAYVGVGLIEVTRTSHKERAIRRARPMADTEGRSDRIAAVGRAYNDGHARLGRRNFAQAMYDDAFYHGPAATCFGF